MALAPWIIPPNYLGAMEAGSRQGLAERSQDEVEKSAADRLSLAYNQLAIQERASDERARLTLANAQAAQSLKAQGLALVGQRLQQQAQQAKDLLEYKNDSLGERNRHNEAMETIDTDKAANMLRRGEALPITFPEFPGQTFIKQPSGTILKVESTRRAPTVQVDAATGLPKTYTGSINDPALRAVMGTNAPPMSAAASLQSPRPALAPNPAAGTAPVIPVAPAKEQRQENQQYQTPKGVFTWTADGWTTPDASP